MSYVIKQLGFVINCSHNFFSKFYFRFDDQILPSSGLINAFSNEVGRKSVLKLLPVFKGVMDLRIRHAATLKPAVKDLADPPQHALSAPWWDRQTVDAGQEKSVRIRQVSVWQSWHTLSLKFTTRKCYDTGNWRVVILVWKVTLCCLQPFVIFNRWKV